MDLSGAPNSEESATIQLGELMQRHRDRRGLSQRALGELLSLERSNLSQFETGARVPPPDVMQRWFAVFGHDPEVERLHLAALGERGLDRRARQGRSQTRQGEPRSARPPDAEFDRPARTLAETDEARAARVVSAENGIAEAVDLLREVEESDLGSEMLERIDRAVDRLCCSYSSRPPDEVRIEARRWLMTCF